MRRLFFPVTALIVLALDQATKAWCMAHLELNLPVPWIDHVVYLTLTYNKRGAFSLFPFPKWLFVLVICILLLAIVYYAFTLPAGSSLQILLGMVGGGGLGNLVDRIRFGHVVDFLDLRWWPVFNLADSAISISIVLIVLSLSVAKKKPGCREA